MADKPIDFEKAAKAAQQMMHGIPQQGIRPQQPSMMEVVKNQSERSERILKVTNEMQSLHNESKEVQRFVELVEQFSNL